MGRRILAVIAIAISLWLMDFIIHQLILGGIYESRSDLWRPEEEMMSKMWIGVIVYLVSCFAFVWAYATLVSNKSMEKAILFGVYFGLFAGIGMGYGSYIHMPIPYSLAAGWFWFTWAEMIVAGVVLGLIIKEDAAA